jgi:hypothetical protein
MTPFKKYLSMSSVPQNLKGPQQDHICHNEDGSIFFFPVAKLIVPDKVDSSIGLCTGLPAYVAWRAGVRQPYARVNFIPPVRDYEFGYWMK